MHHSLHSRLSAWIALAAVSACASSGLPTPTLAAQPSLSPLIVAANAATAQPDRPTSAVPGPAGDIVELGPHVRLPRAVFEALSPDERMVLLRGVAEAERSASLRKGLVAGIFVVAVAGAVVGMYLTERRRLETARLLVEKGHPLPENLAAGVLHPDHSTGALLGLPSGSRLGNIAGGLIWMVFGAGALVLAHARSGQIGVFWVFGVFILVGIGYLIAAFRKPGSKP